MSALSLPWWKNSLHWWKKERGHVLLESPSLVGRWDCPASFPFNGLASARGFSPSCVFVDVYTKRLKAQLYSISMKKSDSHLPWELTRQAMIIKSPLDKF